jgi:hypothetical protein
MTTMKYTLTDLNKLKNVFRKDEIKSIESFLYQYIEKKKIVVYVPLKYVDKLTYDMGHAGAGIIGNYELCSFRMKGLGTFRPNQKSNPFSGQKNQLSFEEEVRLEMECNEYDLDKVIDAMLNNHPYEEVAYEIYDFTKRTKTPTGFIIGLKRKMRIDTLVSRIKKDIDFKIADINFNFKKIATTNRQITNTVIEKALINNCEFILSNHNNIFNIKKI